ncbi:MAG: Holliday junction branch migration protein RuvA, partial [Elusimicrobia bacterium]|nr:Holliday junction branch migration protein RuvA [Elusimicrobiota bacterium]
MIGFIKGEIIFKDGSSVIVSANGVGYEVNVAQINLEKFLPGMAAEFFITESMSPYDGVSLYGFLSREEKELFMLLKQSVPNT